MKNQPAPHSDARRAIPYVSVKVFEEELTPAQTADLISRVTEAVIPFVGEKLRQATWVVVEEVKSGAWGVGGKALGLADVRAIQAGEPPA